MPARHHRRQFAMAKREHLQAFVSEVGTGRHVRPPFQHGAAQWAVWFLCFMGLQRCFAFLGWLTVLVVSPRTITAGRA